ncbi:RNA-binding protein [Clostridiisalibacter paucivorans]|uniref:YlmH family RNA-binding protein n=1 Tax=Clostridiisalibacter paucivorans TaxID=408753 RepID=UPI000684BF34|nr:YlmH/Sll1252 family protein [Clostridiisalibacter paucivorans]
MIIDKLKYIEHINDKSQLFMARRVLDKIEQVLNNHVIENTDFLDPYQRKICYSFLNRFYDMKYHEDGGYLEAERKSIIIYPDYISREYIERYISVIRIDGNFKFNDVSHRDYLGALMGLGIKREKIGDIIVHDDFGQIIVDKDIKDFIILSLKAIGKESVDCSEILPSDIVNSKEEFRIIMSTIASLRLDNLLSAGYKVSRTQSSNIIKQGKVKVNWQPISQSSYEVKEGDIISVKGKGRILLKEVLGNTKKDRIRVAIKSYI